jgi:hypothetical protein
LQYKEDYLGQRLEVEGQMGEVEKKEESLDKGAR